MPITAKSYGPTDYGVNSRYVWSTGAYPSASGDGEYHRHGYISFVNYCPYCHVYGCLSIEIGYGNHNPEGMVYCLRCDMDFSLVSGREHRSGSHY